MCDHLLVSIIVSFISKWLVAKGCDNMNNDSYQVFQKLFMPSNFYSLSDIEALTVEPFKSTITANYEKEQLTSLYRLLATMDATVHQISTGLAEELHKEGADDSTVAEYDAKLMTFYKEKKPEFRKILHRLGVDIKKSVQTPEEAFASLKNSGLDAIVNHPWETEMTEPERAKPEGAILSYMQTIYGNDVSVLLFGGGFKGSKNGYDVIVTLPKDKLDSDDYGKMIASYLPIIGGVPVRYSLMAAGASDSFMSLNPGINETNSLLIKGNMKVAAYNPDRIKESFLFEAAQYLNNFSREMNGQWWAENKDNQNRIASRITRARKMIKPLRDFLPNLKLKLPELPEGKEIDQHDYIAGVVDSQEALLEATKAVLIDISREQV